MAWRMICIEDQKKISRLHALKAEPERMIVQCKGGRISDCRVIEVLGDHDLCVSDHKTAAQ